MTAPPTARWPSPRKALRELARGAAMVRTGGLGAGWRFLREEVVGNGWLRLAEGSGAPAHGARVVCNLCGWAGSRFATHVAPGYLDRNAFCPRCRSYARHRGFAWLAEHELADELARLAGRDGRRLLFAPEPGLRSLLETRVGPFEGTDLDGEREGVDLVADAQDLPLEDATVDLAVSFHVLEHVPDDRAALRELARVLAPGGRVLLCAPTDPEREETVEFGAARADLNGHWREYGLDLVERCAEAGLVGRVHRLSVAVPRREYERLALVDELILWLGRADAADAG